MSPDSGQLIVKPATSHCAKLNRWSPTHAIGRYDSTLSSAVSLSKPAPPSAAVMNAVWLWRTPLGLPVVPDV